MSTTYTVKYVTDPAGDVLAWEYHITRYSDPVAAQYAEEATLRNAELTAAAFGSCAATTGYGYCVSTTPLPPCTC